MLQQLGLIGCGLMGGSFALALRQAGLVNRVVGYSKSASTRARALQLGVIDSAADSPLGAATGCDLVLLAVPVAATESSLRAIGPAVHGGMLVMDVGSTKQDVVAAAQRALGEHLCCFVPAHPVAGSEASGVEHAQANLYQQRQVILTPDARTSAPLLAKARAVWSAIGSHVLEMTPQAHDAAFAAISHLPHLLSFALVNSITQQSRGADFLRLAGPGFRDFSRIAASEPGMWRDILRVNQAEVLAQCQQFRASLLALEQAMLNADGAALESLIEQASQTRAQWRMGPVAR